MKDTIYRQDAIKAVDAFLGTDAIVERIKTLSSADRPQGEWVRYMGDIWTCSACGESLMCDDIECNNFCPNCGARMKGADDEV